VPRQPKDAALTGAEKAFLERAEQEARREVDRMGFDLDAGLAAVQRRALDLAERPTRRAPAGRMSAVPARPRAKVMAISRVGAFGLTQVKMASIIALATVSAATVVIGGNSWLRQSRSPSDALGSVTSLNQPTPTQPQALAPPEPGSNYASPTRMRSHLSPHQGPADATGRTTVGSAAAEPTAPPVKSDRPIQSYESGAGTCVKKSIVVPVDAGIALDSCAVRANYVDVVFNGVGLVADDGIATRSAPKGGTSASRRDCEKRLVSSGDSPAPSPIVAAACLRSARGTAYVDVQARTPAKAVVNLVFWAGK